MTSKERSDWLRAYKNVQSKDLSPVDKQVALGVFTLLAQELMKTYSAADEVFALKLLEDVGYAFEDAMRNFPRCTLGAAKELLSTIVRYAEPTDRVLRQHACIEKALEQIG